jgi:toxin ParE1/3/4
VHRIVFAPEANDQLVELYHYVAKRGSPAVAASFTGAIVDYCERLAQFPRRGTKRDDIRPGLRTVGFRRRVTIAFAVNETAVTILGAFYGGRDFESSLREDFSLPPPDHD